LAHRPSPLPDRSHIWRNESRQRNRSLQEIPISTIVATRVLRPRWAGLWAAFFNFIAFAFFGTKVANTVGQTVKPAFTGVAVIFAAVLGAILWNYATWWLRIPTSSSHALIGGLVGAGIARGGLEAIKASSVQKAALFIVVSSVAGMLLAAGLMVLVNWWLAGHHESGNERVFKAGQLLSSAAVSLGHGTNDAQKTMGVIAALLVATGHLAGGGDKLTIPLWVVLAAHLAIALGTLSGGWRIVQTMGMRITELRAARAWRRRPARRPRCSARPLWARRCRPPTRSPARSPVSAPRPAPRRSTGRSSARWRCMGW
jgi:PiT family inorganic phosphate transporter